MPHVPVRYVSDISITCSANEVYKWKGDETTRKATFIYLYLYPSGEELYHYSLVMITDFLGRVF